MIWHVVAQLGREHQLVALVGQMAAYPFFRQAITTGGIQEGDALINSKMQQVSNV